MTTLQTIGLGIAIVVGIFAMLAYVSMWVEPREEDPPAKDPFDIDTEFL